MEVEDIINDGDHVILKKENIMKAFQIKKERVVWFDKQKLLLDGAIGCPFGCVFEIKDKGLIRVEYLTHLKAGIESTELEIKDNRFLRNDGKSQKLTKDDIEVLKTQGLTGKEIIEHLIENSTTFSDKNEYSKVKYLKKKEQKYLNYVVILKPNTRILTEMYYCQGPLKILNLRMDSLAQVLSFANIHSGGQYVVVESCMGLLVGAVIERLGGHGKVIHLHTDGIQRLPILESYNFSKKHLQCLLTLTIKDAYEFGNGNTVSVKDSPQNVDVNQEESEFQEQGSSDITSNSDALRIESESRDGDIKKVLKMRQRKEEKRLAMSMMSSKNVDGLIIASKFHPSNILQLLIPCLAFSRCFVVFCPYKEPLIECYGQLKEKGNALMLHLSETWCRPFQVLPDRTHPNINMSGSSGYILSGITAECNKHTIT